MKTAEEVVTSLEDRLGRSKRSGAETRFDCPYCYKHDGYVDRKKHLHVNIGKKIVHCFRCGTAKPLHQLFRDLHLNALAREYVVLRSPVEIQLKSVELPDDIIYPWKAYSGETWEAYAEEIAYAKKRGMNMTNWHYFGFLYDKVLIFNSKANISHYWERNIYDKHFNMPSAAKPLYFLDEASKYPVIVIAEGPFDALAWNAGSIRHGVALIGKSISDFQLGNLSSALSHKKDFTEIVIALDAGEFEATAELAKRITSGLSAMQLGHKVRLSYIKLPTVFTSKRTLPKKFDADELPYQQREELFKARKKISLTTLMQYAFK
jgi:hypothetical protein